MRNGKVAAIGALMLLAGGAGGWFVRARHDWAQIQQIAADAFAHDLLTSRVHSEDVTTQHSDGSETKVDHDADLRCLMHDPDAMALPATVRRVSRSDGMDDGDMVVELEVETARGTFRTGWRGVIVPAIGRGVRTDHRPPPPCGFGHGARARLVRAGRNDRAGPAREDAVPERGRLRGPDAQGL